ncbi:EamA family transporter [Holophaga foetida]|uniref:EamA family transporter n=1 Tax=Holophaga foetida TaxID=35839 RepID=UPI000247174B|nr:EamA family transporter [Holophaga foetida]
MVNLLIVSFIWAASFSLIKTYLVSVPPDIVNAVRLGLTLAVFLPFLSWKKVHGWKAMELTAIGAIQFGAMSFFYTRSFGTLQAHEAALATIMTPLYVILLDDLLEHRIQWLFLGCALLSALGTAISLGILDVGLKGLGMASPKGLLLIQASNLCFAAGQVWYRRAMGRGLGLGNAQAFAWCAVGAALVAGVAAIPSLVSRGLPVLGRIQLGVLFYLGVIASGMGFFLWNVGARKVNAGVLAVMNDLKIPSAMLVAVLLFGEKAAWIRLGVGGAIMCLAWWLASRFPRGEKPVGRG